MRPLLKIPMDPISLALFKVRLEMIRELSRLQIRLAEIDLELALAEHAEQSSTDYQI